MWKASSSSRCSVAGGSGVPAVVAEAAAGRDAQDGGLQLGEALAPRRDGGHDGDAEVPGEHLGVRHAPAPRAPRPRG